MTDVRNPEKWHKEGLGYFFPFNWHRCLGHFVTLMTIFFGSSDHPVAREYRDPLFKRMVNITEDKIYARKGLKSRCRSEFLKTTCRWTHSTVPVQCVNLWGLKVRTARFTFNSLTEFLGLMCVYARERRVQGSPPEHFFSCSAFWDLGWPNERYGQEKKKNESSGQRGDISAPARLFSLSLKESFQAVYAALHFWARANYGPWADKFRHWPWLGEHIPKA